MVAPMRTIEATIHPVAATVLAMSSGRLGAFAASIVGLIGIVIGGRALARSAGRGRAVGGTGDRGRDTAVAMLLGLTSLVIGGLIVVTSDGGVGSGNGLGGAFVAMALGLIGIVVGGLARARERQVA
jgi:Family of unknown function (DUF6223)